MKTQKKSTTEVKRDENGYELCRWDALFYAQQLKNKANLYYSKRRAKKKK